MVIPKSARFLAMIIVLGACAQSAPGAPAGPDGDKVIFTGDQKSDWAQIAALEDEAKAIVKTGGCSSAGECRT
ncbi:MAG TPA: hypothetical protein VF836_12375, partial [Gemmatimonadaceae bacterium]